MITLFIEHLPYANHKLRRISGILIIILNAMLELLVLYLFNVW